MATTVVRRRDTTAGNFRVILGQLNLSTSSDTWNTGLKSIVSFSVDGGSAAVTTVTVSGGTLTIGSSAGITGCWVIAYGYG
jgi:hypothetical protein